MLTKKLELGSLNIFDDVIKLITHMAISEIEEIDLRSVFSKTKLFETFKKSPGNITVISENNDIILNIKIGIVNGNNIPKTVIKLQKLIQNHIEEFTGFHVKEINVIIDHIIFEK